MVMKAIKALYKNSKKKFLSSSKKFDYNLIQIIKLLCLCVDGVLNMRKSNTKPMRSK